MGAWFFDSGDGLIGVAVSAVAMYVAALVLLRVTERRTLAQLRTFDLVVTISIGAIVGRTATTPDPPVAQGVVAIAALVVLHAGVARARRRWPVLERVVTRAPVVLVADGRIDEAACAHAAVTPADLAAVLRNHGIADVSEAALVVLEARGSYSVLRQRPRPGSLVVCDLAGAAGDSDLSPSPSRAAP